ncbi:hypothetical protein PVAP13_4KG055100 [Panicum virgatum]|uniref:Uncharacterized protein n=1 Tax=Panicum virgatum TaxID=38727 RepID=A0A8T0TG08_PANVG|nr:hypothetical protein PVAP13_4KG055100 [Panicum virgatum]
MESAAQLRSLTRAASCTLQLAGPKYGSATTSASGVASMGINRLSDPSASFGKNKFHENLAGTSQRISSDPVSSQGTRSKCSKEDFKFIKAVISKHCKSRLSIQITAVPSFFFWITLGNATHCTVPTRRRKNAHRLLAHGLMAWEQGERQADTAPSDACKTGSRFTDVSCGRAHSTRLQFPSAWQWCGSPGLIGV